MPSAAPFWEDEPASWDVASLGGHVLPGLARIDGLELSSKWDVKEAAGTDGATETYQGYTPAPFQLVLRIWERAQWERWLSIAPKLRPRPGKETPLPLDIVHPDLAVWNISRAILRKVKPKKIPDFYEVSMELTEYFPQPKKTVTATMNGVPGLWNALDGSPNPGQARPQPPSKGNVRP